MNKGFRIPPEKVEGTSFAPDFGFEEVVEKTESKAFGFVNSFDNLAVILLLVHLEFVYGQQLSANHTLNSDWSRK